MKGLQEEMNALCRKIAKERFEIKPKVFKDGSCIIIVSHPIYTVILDCIEVNIRNGLDPLDGLD
jgi:hypothetical protein